MRRGGSALLGLTLILWLALASHADTPLRGTAVRISPDGTMEIQFSGPDRPQRGDVFILRRNGETVGECSIVDAQAHEPVAKPCSGLLGKAKVGDELVFLQHGGSAAATDGWLQYYAPEAGFKVHAPSVHELRTRDEPRKRCTLHFQMDIFRDYAQRQSYIISFCDLPASPDDMAPSEPKTLEESLKANHMSLLSRGMISMGGMETAEINMKSDDGSYATQRTFLTDKRMYQLYVYGQNHPITERASRFYHSFELLSTAGRPMKAPPVQSRAGGIS